MSAEVNVFDDRACELGEGPTYDAARNRVVWVDILGCRVLWQHISDGSRGELPTADHVGAVLPRRDGNYTVVLRQTIDVIDADTGEVLSSRPMPAEHLGAEVPIRANDAKVDRSGRLYFGTMAYEPQRHQGRSALYVDRGEVYDVAVANVSLSNGLGWSPDGSSFYYVDTVSGGVDRFDVLAQGELANRRRLVTIDDGGPDGLCIDSEGAIWLAVWGTGEVRRYLPDGALDRVVEVGTPHVSSCAFVGEALDLLVITSARQDLPADQLAGAGVTYAVRPGVIGLPTNLHAN